MLKSNQKAFEGARKYANEIEAKVSKYLDLLKNKETFNSDETLALDKEICASVKPGFWEHCKSSPGARMYYEVFDVGSHVNYDTNGHAFQVAYASQYGRRKGRKGYRELLGADGFLTPYNKDGYVGPRFIYRGKICPSD